MLVHVLLTVLLNQVADDEIAKWRGQIIPAEKSLAWRSLAWHASLWDALRAAEKLDRPILLYAMNGHPLACT